MFSSVTSFRNQTDGSLIPAIACFAFELLIYPGDSSDERSEDSILIVDAIQQLKSGTSYLSFHGSKTMANKQNDESKPSESRSLLKASYDLEYLLMGDIRTLLGEKHDLQTRSSLLILLNRLILNLPTVLEQSSHDGYLNRVLERRPGWSRQIDALHQANLDCISSLTLLRDCLENDKSITTISKELELRLQNWIESFSAMRSQESTILQKAFSVDLGGEA